MFPTYIYCNLKNIKYIFAMAILKQLTNILISFALTQYNVKIIIKVLLTIIKLLLKNILLK